MNSYKGYLIDLDGTIFRGNELIPGASEFVSVLKDKNIPYLFLTNNSSASPEAIAEKLTTMNISATPENIFTSSMATARYIKRIKQKAICYVIGESGLKQSLEKEGLKLADEAVEFVVTGIDRQINYEKLAHACLHIRSGAKFISTNSDISIPTERGLLPGNGALTSVISTSTKVSPTFIGKPEKTIMEEAIKELGVEKSQVVMVGDNYHTDILAGLNSDIATLLVFTGVTSRIEHDTFERKAKHTVDNLMDWVIK